MTVGVVADSAASIPLDKASSLGVVVVPMQLSLVYPDGRESEMREDQISIEEVLAHLETGRIKTSAPPPGAFLEAIEQADQGDGVVVCTVTERVSSSIRSAKVASGLSGRLVEVVDTGSAAGGEALVVLAAAKAAKEGLGVAEVTETASSVAGRLRLVAAVSSLDYLQRGGRLPPLAASIGRLIGAQPVFELSQGRIRPLTIATSHERAQSTILGRLRRSATPNARLHLAALGAVDHDLARRTAEAAALEFPPVEYFEASFTPVMIAHTGPGVWGLAWWWEEEQ